MAKKGKIKRAKPMPRAQLLAEEPVVKPHETVTGRTFKVKDGREVLEMDLRMGGIKEKNPEIIRCFIWENGFVTWDGVEWNPKIEAWRIIYNNMYVVAHDPEFVELEQRFCNKYGYSDFDGLQTGIIWERQRRSVQNKFIKTQERAAAIQPPLPAGFTQWIKNRFFRSKRPLTRVDEEVVLLQEYNDKCITRYFRVYRAKNSTREFITENFIGIGRRFGWSDKFYYGIYRGAYGRKQSWTDRKSEAAYYGGKQYRWLYDGNLEELGYEERVLRVVRYEIEHRIKARYPYHLDHIYNNPVIEYIYKCTTPKLIEDYRKGLVEIERTQDGEGVSLGIDGEELALLREINGGSIELKALKKALPCNWKNKKRDLVKLGELKREEARDILNLCIKYELPIAHVITLLSADYSNIRKYTDYLDMAQKRGCNVKDEIIYRNKRWEEYHDRYTEDDAARRARENARTKRTERSEKNKQFPNIKGRHAENKAHFNWENDDYIIRVAASPSEIMTEGQTQHHCVAASDNYFDKMNRKVSFILFLRRKTNTEAPYYTIEAQWDGRVLQAYGAYDRKLDWGKVEPLLAEWTKEIKKRSKKEQSKKES